MVKPLNGTLQVTEIFKSIQGESTHAGLPCSFVRLTGCNLRCGYCDTEYAFFGGTEMTLKTILQKIKRFGVFLVEITGGEPLLQPNSIVLAEELIRKGYRVMVETGGSIDISPLPPETVVILDVKCPGSGMEKRIWWNNLEQLKPTDQVKFVISDRSDFLWAGKIVRKYSLDKKCAVLFSAAEPQLEDSRLADWLLDSKIPARLNVQLHKRIWDLSRGK